MQKMPVVLLCTGLMFLALVGCSSESVTTAEPTSCDNVAGTWSVTVTVDARACGEGLTTY